MKLFVAGHRGMVGSALVRRFGPEPGISLLLRDRRALDLCDLAAVRRFFLAERPDAAVIAAARVGGIHANATYPADFLRDNLAIALGCIEAAREAGTGRLLFLGSSCIYPKLAPQPMPESCLLSGPLEPTNEAYAIAKIAGLKLAQAYRRQYGLTFHSAMPTNLYGPGDNYHPENAHVLPALIRRFHEAKRAGRPSVAAWGTGAPKREFLHVDDLADACAFLLRLPDPPDWINVASGEEVTIRELTERIAAVVGYRGTIEWDPTRPDGTPRKLLDGGALTRLGWRAKIPLEEGLRRTYADFLAEEKSGALRG